MPKHDKSAEAKYAVAINGPWKGELFESNARTKTLTSLGDSYKYTRFYSVHKNVPYFELTSVHDADDYSPSKPKPKYVPFSNKEYR